MSKLVALVRSRRFWASVGGVAIVVGDMVGMSPAFSEELVWLIAAWVVGDSIRATA